MHLRNYIKLLFVLMLTVSVGLFMFSAYALLAGRAMEKEFIKLTQEVEVIKDTHREVLVNMWITEYEKNVLKRKYSKDLYINPFQLCYSQNIEKEGSENFTKINQYNESCKGKGINESTVREEIEESYKKFAQERWENDDAMSMINSRIYADDSGKGKLDTAILDTFTKMAGIGTAISVLVLILIYRIPETTSERKDEHPKHK